MRRGPVAGLSWLQLIAGALAAMTSAWVASYLGVAGTVIGAAVGSLVASLASALYIRGLDHGTTFITESGTVVARSEPAGQTTEGESVEVLATADDSAVAVSDSQRAFSWRRVLIWTVFGAVLALMAIGAYELATGSSFGRAENPVIGRPWQERSPAPSSEPTADADQGQRPTTPTQQPSTAPTTPASEPSPSPSPSTDSSAEPTPEPEPEPEPTELAPPEQ